MTQLVFVLCFTVCSLLEPFGSRFIEFNISNCAYNKQNWSVTIQHPVWQPRYWHWKLIKELNLESKSGREKRRDESFQAQAEKPLGTNSHQTKRSSKCWLLIGHKKCFVLLCPIDEQHLLSSFCEFVHDLYWLDHSLSGSCTKELHAVRKLSV